MKKLFNKSFAAVKGFFNTVRQSRALSSLILMFLILNMAITASVAWFAINRQTGADEMGMALKVDETQAVYKAYMYSLESGCGTNETTEHEELTISNMVLNQYDTIFSGQNRFTPAFAQITLNVNQAMENGGKLYITITRKTDAEHEDTLAAVTSNIVRFTVFTVPDHSDLDKTTPEALYEHINTPERFSEVDGLNGNSLPYSKTFVTATEVNGDREYDVSSSLTLELDFTADDLYQNGKCLNVYLYISYDSQLIRYYLNEHGGGGLSMEETSISFLNDLELVTVSHD